MTNHESGFHENPGNLPEHPTDPNTLREVLGMLEELKADEGTVLDIIEEVLAEPIPDIHDPEAMVIFEEKMKAVRIAAESQLSRSDLILTVQRRIEEKLAASHAQE